MQNLDQVGASIKAHIPEILEDLQASCRSEPWCTLPPEERLNNLAAVIRGLVDVALCSQGDSHTGLEEVRAAAEHGEHRFKVGFPELLVPVEFSLLSGALWRFLHSQVPIRIAHDASVRLDAASAVAIKAALRGYHRPAFEARGEWPGVIHQLADQLPVWIERSAQA